MAPATLIPINGKVLAWAMQQAGVEDLELAERCGVAPEIVAEWRKGRSQPTKTQFRRLVARLRRPSSVYFLAEPPENDPVIRAFRSPPGVDGERSLLDAELRAIQTAERLQKVARWVREHRQDDPVEIPRVGPATGINDALRSARRFLSWQVTDQFSAPSTSAAARSLREAMEGAGILVLQFSMTEGGCRGFSLYDDLAPVIAVNSAYTVEARVFSYMHEYAHLSRGAGSFCARLPDSNLERRCEEFAAAFLMPRRAFQHYVDQTFGPNAAISSLDDVAKIARRFKVSLRAAALRLQKLQRAVPDLYSLVDAEADFKGGSGFTRDNSAPAVRLREWGASYAGLVLEAERRGWLGRTDALEYLNVSNGQLSDLRARVEAGTGTEG